MTDPKMMAQMVGGAGFIAALDQSGGSTPKALAAYGVGEDAWGSEDEMFGLIHQMRQRIVTAPSFSGKKVLGAILFFDAFAPGVEHWRVVRVGEDRRERLQEPPGQVHGVHGFQVVRALDGHVSSDGGCSVHTSPHSKRRATGLDPA